MDSRFRGNDDIRLADDIHGVAKLKWYKDILALANSWRLTTAYILIGVKEVKGGRSDIVGVESHLDDANLHQFVNMKTQRPVEFSYLPFRAEGVEIGVIEIPIQERPIFLTRRYGHIRENEVLIRDGSSTRTASPDEIIKMGVEQVSSSTPHFTLEWADIDNHNILPSPYTIDSLVLDPPLHPETFTRRRPHGLNTFANKNYSREVIAYTTERNLLTPLGLRIQNRSGTVGRRIRFVGQISKSEEKVIQTETSSVPSRYPAYLSRLGTAYAYQKDDDLNIYAREFDNYWEIVVDFGDVRPSDELWTSNVLYLGSTKSCAIILEGEFRGDNVPEPIKCELQVKVEVRRREMTIDDVDPYLSESQSFLKKERTLRGPLPRA